MELVEGCSDCEREGAYKESVGHECGPSSSRWKSSCEVFGQARQNSAEFHRLSHEPERCESCKVVLDDKIGMSRFITRPCRSNLCTEWLCPDCMAVQSSAGPVNCPSCGWTANRPRISRIRRMYAAKSGRRR